MKFFNRWFGSVKNRHKLDEIDREKSLITRQELKNKRLSLELQGQQLTQMKEKLEFLKNERLMQSLQNQIDDFDDEDEEDVDEPVDDADDMFAQILKKVFPQQTNTQTSTIESNVVKSNIDLVKEQFLALSNEAKRQMLTLSKDNLYNYILNNLNIKISRKDFNKLHKDLSPQSH